MITPRRRIGVSIFVAVMTAATLLLPRSAPALAQEAPPPAAAPTSCATPPEGAQATAEDCARFVDLWVPRITNSGWMKTFVEGAAVPADIAAEGFHSLDGPTQAWLVNSLVDQVITTVGVNGQAAGVQPAPAELQKLQLLTSVALFGQQQIKALKDRVNAPSTSNVGENSGDAVPNPLQSVADGLADTPLLGESNAAVPQAPAIPATGAVTDLVNGVVSPALGALIAPDPAPSAAVVPAPPVPSSSTAALDANGLIALIIGLLGTPPISNLLQLITTLLTSVANIQQRLFAIPGLNLLGSLTYRICAQSATQPLACTVNLPIGVPIPTDVNGDNVPDVLGHLAPVIGVPQMEVVSIVPLVVRIVATPDIGFSFEVRRLFPNSGPLPAHVFAVYDPPRTNKRVEYGYDARLSTLATVAKSTVTLKNILSAIKGDVEVLASITHQNPGNNEAITVAMKQLVANGNGLPLERDPMVGAVRFTPVPTTMNANLHLQHHSGKNQDTISLDLNIPSLVTALVTQDVNTVSPASHREFSALIDKLPSHVSVDLLNQNPKQTITYGANAVINHINVDQKSIDNTAQPGTFTRNNVDILGLPQNVKLTLTGAEDILYAASSVIPQMQFLTQQATSSVVQKEIVATAHGIPKNIHLSNVTTADQSTITYDADTSLTDLALGMLDVPNDNTVISALATGFPTHMELKQTKSTGATKYTANGPIQTITAKLTRAGGTTIPLPGIDHATFKKVGNAIGLDLKLSGLAGANIDPSEKASYGLTLSPGGQPFQAIAELDAPNRRADVLISNLPKSIQVDLDPGNGSATYTADQVISSVDARYEEIDTGRLAEVGLDLVPKVINATWATGGDQPQITYSADSHLGAMSAFYQEEPGGTTFFGQISDLPLFMSVAGVDPIIFDAKSGPAAPSHSDDIGQILLRYGSNGVLPATGNAVDHLFLSDTTSTNAELLYSGLSYLKADTANDELHIQVNNSAPRRFEADVITPNMTVDAYIEKIPSEVKVDMVDEQIVYDADSEIDEIGAAVDRLNGDLINVLVKGVPDLVTVNFNSVASTINWSASDVTDEISAAVQFGPATTASSRTYNAGLSILSIPKVWNASFAEGHILFDGVSSAIGSITASFTNHATFTNVAGDGISAEFNEGSGDLDAYLKISALDLVEFQKLDAVGTNPGGFDANLNMGTGGLFTIHADVLTADGVQLTADGTLTNFPTTMHLRSENGVITYNGNNTPTLNLAVAYGKVAAIAATPPTGTAHGVSVRDGVDGSGNKALKANLYITGLPNSLNLNTVTGVYTVNGFDPTIDPLRLDVALDNFVTTPATLLVDQVVGAADGPVNFTFGPFTSGTAGDGSKTINASYVASRGMGSLTGDATIGTNVAHLFISNIPSSLTLAAVFGADTKTINISVGEVVNEITATYKTTSDSGMTAGTTIKDIPAKTISAPSMSLVIGKQGPAAGVQTPVFSYNATAPGLDISAFLDNAVFGPASKAGFTLNVTDFGHTVAANLSGTTLTLGSTPATGSFKLVAHAFLNFNIGLNTGDPGDFFQNTGNLNLGLDVQELVIGFTNMNSLILKLGYSTSIEGNYGTFEFSEKSNLTFELHDHFNLNFGIFTINDVFGGIDIGPTSLGNVIGGFRLARNNDGIWFDFIPVVPVPCDASLIPPDVDFFKAVVRIRPFPHSTTAGAGFIVAGNQALGSPPAWIATVIPFGAVPDWVTDIIAKFTSPLGGSFSFGIECVDN